MKKRRTTNHPYVDNVGVLCNITHTSESNPLEFANNLYVDGIFTTDIVIPDDVITIDSKAFAGCNNITEITLSEGISTISEGLFEKCSSLKHIKLHEGIINIDDNAFKQCDQLETADLPSTLQKMGEHTFYKCTSLHTLYCRSINPLTTTGSYLAWIGVQRH